MQNSALPLTAAGLFRSRWEDTVADTTDRSYAQLWSAFSQAAQTIAESDPEASSVLAFLARICSLRLSNDPSPNPFGVLIATPQGRTMAVEDFVVEEVTFLRHVVKHIDDYRVRARAADLLWVLGERRERATFAAAAIESYQMWSLEKSHWSADGRAAWSRAVDLSKRLGGASRNQLATIESRLREQLLQATEGVQLLQLGEMLLTHRLGVDFAPTIAQKFEAVASALPGQENLRRRYLRLAQDWYSRARNTQNAASMVREQVDSWIREAESQRAADNSSNLAAASFYESALQTYRQLSRAQRQAFDIEALGDELASLARACGLLGLSEMETIATESVDLRDAARDSVDRVAGKDAVTAMFEFVSLAGIRSFREDLAFAEQLLRDHPLSSLFPSVHYSRDGRVVHRTDSTGRTYGIETRVWTQMVQNFEISIRLLVQGALAPAYHQLSNEHALSIGDFQNIALGSSIVPRDRVATVARGLMHGYTGDFSSAVYVLTPQVEHFIRHALREAGVSTSTIDATGVENEIGLTALMQMDEAIDVLGVNLAYELRALFCGPIGPNIRNLAAHGLFDDASHNTAEIFYAWWFVLRLLYAPYWNRRRGSNKSSRQGTPDQQTPET